MLDEEILSRLPKEAQQILKFMECREYERNAKTISE